jgi:hypothetical protein
MGLSQARAVLDAMSVHARAMRRQPQSPTSGCDGSLVNRGLEAQDQLLRHKAVLLLNNWVKRRVPDGLPAILKVS